MKKKINVVSLSLLSLIMFAGCTLDKKSDKSTTESHTEEVKKDDPSVRMKVTEKKGKTTSSASEPGTTDTESASSLSDK